MNEKRNKFLTEKVLGKCWHGREILEMESIICSKCGWPIKQQHLDFDSWQGFGELWEGFSKRKEWIEFVGVYHGSQDVDFGLLIEVYWISPPVFANAVYEFFSKKEVSK